jgi:hypothetical protein
MNRVREIAHPEFPFPDLRGCADPTLFQFIRSEYEMPPCEHCGSVKILGGFMRCCEGFSDEIQQNLPDPMPGNIRRVIEEFTANGRPNFPRSLNANLRPVIQNAKISSPNAAASTIFLTGMPYAVDSFRQFLTPVYAIFNALDRESTGNEDVNSRLVRVILEHNETLRNHVRNRIDTAVQRMQVHLVGSADDGMNLAIMNADGISAESAEFEVLHNTYRARKIKQWTIEYDQLVYPLIFWNGKGGCGVMTDAPMHGSTKRIRKALICLMLQPRDHFIHSLETLREEFICSVSGRLVNMAIHWLLAAQHSYFAREDELRGIDGTEEGAKEFGLRSFIPSSLTDTDQYWHAVAEKCFALSTQIGPPTFFLTMTMNPYWPDYQALKRGSGHYSDATIISIVFRSRLKFLIKHCKSTRLFGNLKAFVWRVEYQQRGLPHAHILLWTDTDTTDIREVDRLINARYPQPSPIQNQQQMISDFRTLIDRFQVHHHTRRCRTSTGACKYRYPQEVNPESRIEKCKYYFARSEADRYIVPHNLELLALLRCHHCLEVIHSSQCIGYILKYCSKNSEASAVNAKIYEGRHVNETQKLELFAAQRLCSSVECKGQIDGESRYHLSPTVGLLPVYLEDKKIVLVHPNQNPEERLLQSSPLEKYFFRPRGPEYDNLTYTQYFSLFQSTQSDQGVQDDCPQRHNIVARSKPAIFILKDVSLRDSERFCLRILLSIIPTRSWVQLRIINEVTYETFSEAARVYGLILDRQDEARTALVLARDLHRPPSNLRFIFALGIDCGANYEALFEEFKDFMRDDGDTDDTIRMKIEKILNRMRSTIGPLETEDLATGITDPDPGPSLDSLGPEQRDIARQIIDTVLNHRAKLMFLQGSAGTGKTYTVKVMLSELQRLGIQVLISATTGIAAVQYPGGQTVHSLFRLGIDELHGARFTSHIGRGTSRARHLLAAGLIIIDEVSMLTPWVARRVSLTLGSIAEGDYGQWDFGGVNVLFVGDLLQLPPVVANMGMPISRRMITRMSCWPNIHKFILTQQHRSENPRWSQFCTQVATGSMEDIKFWGQVQEQFGVRLTQSIDEALHFLCEGIMPENHFPLDRLWIAPTNRLAKEINERIQAWRSASARNLGTLRSLTRLINPFRSNPGLDEGHQIDFIETIETPDLPPHVLHFYEGDACTLLRNISTVSGLVKGRRCWVIDANERIVVIQFENGEQLTLSRIPIEKMSNGIKFERWQIPLRLIYAGTVHRSQGMTLYRAVIDLRRSFWEHGQLYVALSRVKRPENLCILLPESLDESEDVTAVPLRVPVDREIVNIVATMANGHVEEVDSVHSIPTTHPATIEARVEDFDSHLIDEGEEDMSDALQSQHNILDIMWSDQEAGEAQHDGFDPMTEHNSLLPSDHATEDEVESEEEENTEVGRNDMNCSSSVDSLSGDISGGSEESDLKSQKSDITSEVNLDHLCHKILMSVDSILSSAMGNSKLSFMSSLSRIRVMMAKFLVIYRMSKCEMNQIRITFPNAIGVGWVNTDSIKVVGKPVSPLLP